MPLTTKFAPRDETAKSATAQRSTPTENRLQWAVAIGVLLVAASLLLPAAIVDHGGRSVSTSFTDGGFAEWGVVLMSAAATIVAVACAHRFRGQMSQLAAAGWGIALGVAAVIVAFRVMFTDTAVGAQEMGLMVSRGPGAWAMIVVGALVAIASIGWLRIGAKAISATE